MSWKQTSRGYPQFPQSISEFQRRFSTEKACADYWILVRWPNGFECPNCSHKGAWRISIRSFRCHSCRKKIFITAGTLMHRSHLPLRYWFWAAHLMSTLTPGISALQLMRQLKIGSYEIALYLCRRLRKAMVNPEREPLMGTVEVDDFYIGGSEKDVRGREIETKAACAAAVENICARNRLHDILFRYSQVWCLCEISHKRKR